jgi:choline-sulfatase
MPLIIAGPGIGAGRRVDELVYQHCMYATTCELAGVPVPETVEFPSLVPLLHGEHNPVYGEVFSYYLHYQRMVRTKTHKLIVYPHILKTQLFDIERDPWEMHDLSDDTAAQEIKKDLMERMVKMQKQLDDPLKLWFA